MRYSVDLPETIYVKKYPIGQYTTFYTKCNICDKLLNIANNKLSYRVF